MKSAWLERYILLFLRTDKLFNLNDNYYVDAYIGPNKLKETVINEKIKSPDNLLKEGEKLLNDLSNEEFENTRKTYLKKQIRAVNTILKVKSGKNIDLKDQVESILDIKYKWVDESKFKKGIEYFKEGLPPNGSLTDRYNEWIQRNIYSFDNNDKKLDYLKFIIKELKERTNSILNLPDNENIKLKIVKDKRFGASTRYLGDYTSLLEINEDIPFNFFQLIPLITHELYPGHHTEFCLKEKNLIREKNYFENNVFLLNSPQLVISEGLGEVGFDLIFSSVQAAEWMKENIYKNFNINIKDVDLELLIKASRYNSLDQISSNAAIMLKKGYAKKEVKKYIKKYSLQPEVMLDHVIKNLCSSDFKKVYSFTYYHGKKLISSYLNSEKSKKYERLNYLMKDQVFPSVIKK